MRAGNDLRCGGGGDRRRQVGRPRFREYGGFCRRIAGMQGHAEESQVPVSPVRVWLSLHGIRNRGAIRLKTCSFLDGRTILSRVGVSNRCARRLVSLAIHPSDWKVVGEERARWACVKNRGYAASIFSNLSIEAASGNCGDDLSWFCELIRSQIQATFGDCKMPCPVLNTASRANSVAFLLELDLALALATEAAASRLVNC